MSQGNFFRVNTIVGGGGRDIQAAAMAPNLWFGSHQVGSSTEASFPATALSGGLVSAFRAGDQVLVDCDERLEYHVADGPDWSVAPIGFKAAGFSPIVLWSTGSTLWLRPYGGVEWTGPVFVGASA